MRDLRWAWVGRSTRCGVEYGPGLGAEADLIGVEMRYLIGDICWVGVVRPPWDLEAALEALRSGVATGVGVKLAKSVSSSGPNPRMGVMGRGCSTGIGSGLAWRGVPYCIG